MTPGTDLRAEILRLGLDQGVVASETDVSRQTINNIVNDRQPISRSMAAKLARVTGQSSDYWLRSSYPDDASPDGGVVDAEPQPGRRPAFNSVLVNHQIIAAVQDGIIGIDPFAKDNVQRASIDLTLDDFIITAAGQRLDISEGQSFPLQSGDAVNVKTREWVEFPLDYIGRVGAMTRVAKYGIIMSHGLQVDPGFKGHLQFCLFNAGASTFPLRSQQPIVSLEIMQLSSLPHVDATAARFDSGDSRDDVASHFQASVDPQSCSRLIRDFIGSQVRPMLNAGMFSARIPQLEIVMNEQSEPAAVACVVMAALDGLRALRSHPGLRTPQNERYDAFVGELSKQLLLSRQDCHAALATLGLALNGSDNAIVTLRNGQAVLLHLPKKAARITFMNLATQLLERPDDLLLMLTGHMAYGAAVPNNN